ncbi:hypothetical protein BGW38_009391, partial [Lunasporangiospora selenospora]
LTFVDQWTVRLTGGVISHGDSRAGYPVSYKFDQDRKQRRKAPHTAGEIWGHRLAESGLTRDEAADYAKQMSDAKKAKEAEVKESRKTVNTLERARLEAARVVNQSRVSKNQSAGLPRGTTEYLALHQARQKVREARKKLVPQELQLESLKKATYQLNKMAKASKVQTSAGELTPTVVTWDQPAVTEKTENLDVSQLLSVNNHGGRACVVVMGGTDYGLRTMSETVGVSIERIQAHLKLFQESVTDFNPFSVLT